MSELNRGQIEKQMQEWSDQICNNACLKGEYLNGRIVACETCFPNTVRNALALIKELTEENEGLHASCTELARVQEENERLKKDNEYILMQHAFQRRPSGDCWNDVIEKAKADTVRKMQEALEQRIHSKLSYHGWYLKETVIAEIAKEMLGEVERN